MIEQRRFHRVRFTAKSELNHNDITYQGQLENISLSGALVSCIDGIIVPQGEECTLTVYLDWENLPLRLVVEIIHASFTMVGMKFVSCDADTKGRLYKLMERVTTEPDRLRNELRLLDRESD
ncbi:MAG: type IV pilus assembly [Geobacteraceae bacterium]|nr:MAG: type IV pilus assembly [Geobacteraceae bacterium]